MTTTVPNRFAEGELVDVALSGLRYADTRAGHLVLVGDAGRGDGEPYELVVPVSARMKVTRVAPKEWPPQTGDIWVDGQGREYLGHVVDGEPGEDPYALLKAIDSRDHLGSLADSVAENGGPMRLIRRRGWTPDAEPEPVEVDERATYVDRLRALADLVESRTDLPVPNSSVAVQYSVLGPYHNGEAARLGEVARVAGLLGVEVVSDGTTAYFEVAADTKYVVHTFRDHKPVAPEPAPSDVDEAAAAPEPTDLAAAAAVAALLDEPTSALPIVPAEDDETDGRCSGSLVDPWQAMTDHEHRCELYGDDHSGTHICICGRQWPAHYETAGTVDDTGAGGNSAECACGVTFAGFDTHAEARALLERHIADAKAEVQS